MIPRARYGHVLPLVPLARAVAALEAESVTTIVHGPGGVPAGFEDNHGVRHVGFVSLEPVPAENSSVQVRAVSPAAPRFWSSWPSMAREPLRRIGRRRHDVRLC